MYLNLESFNLFNSDFFDSRVGNKEKYLSGLQYAYLLILIF